MRSAGPAAAARAPIVAAALMLSMSGGCSRPPLPEQDGVDAAPVAPAFLAVTPCLDQAAYATGAQTVTFGFLGTPAGFVYEPRCLEIDAGQTVTFSGSFAAHPLYPSMKRGTLVDNPIGGISAGDSKDVLFPHPGFFAYYCGVHGGSDDGSTMAGVVWVR